VYYPVDSLPQVLNPASGYVYNCNHSPFQSSGQQDNPDPTQIPETMGFLPDGIFTNRGYRLHQLLSHAGEMDYDEFKRIKYDLSYGKPLSTGFGMQLEAVFELDSTSYPELAPSLHLIRNWDRVTDVESEAAGCFVSFAYFLGRELRKTDLEPGDIIPTSVIVSALKISQAHLLRYFGSYAVPLGKLQRHIRGEVDLPLAGGPDILAAVSGRLLPDGRLQARSGDSYIELVRYSTQGVEIESINAYGASSRPGDPHYTDQMQHFAQQQLKPMTLDKADILRSAERVYHPR
jgi:acyl-homoserine-lactone acylase